MRKLFRAIDYFKFGLHNEDYRLDSLIFLMRFKIQRFYDTQSKLKYPDTKMLQVYRLLIKISEKYLYGTNNPEIKSKRLKLFFDILVKYNENWYI